MLSLGRRGVFRRLAEPSVKFWSLAGFLLLVFLTGGGARQDIISLVILRPAAALFAIFAAFLMTQAQLRSVRVPLLFLTALATIIALQLVPLPPALWEGLPGRAVPAEALAAAGIENPWEPLALSPERALNSLFSLVVPLAVLLGFAMQEPARRPQLLRVLWALSLLSVMLGILQLFGSPNGPLYLYRITNNGLPVGLFANRNHQGLMVAISIMLAAYLASCELSKRRINMALLTGYIGSILLFLPFLLVAGSRAGLLLGFAMLIPASYLLYRVLILRSQRFGRAFLKSPHVRIAIIATCVAIAAIVVSAILLSRSLAFDRLTGSNIEGDLRAAVLPTVLDITAHQFPWGSGFGGFEFIYKQVEPDSLLMPAYLNHAHNDWVEFILEGGALAAIFMVTFVAWIVRAAFSQLRRWRQHIEPEAFTVAIIALAYAAASLVDYPMRAPSLMAVFAVVCATLAVRQVKD